MELRCILSLAIAVAAASCAASRWSGDQPADLPADAEVRSLSGEALYSPPLADDVRERREAALAAAERALEEHRGDPLRWVAVGRQLASLGRYRDAVHTYGQAIGRFGDEVHLLRHRGHRWITLRQPWLAADELERAAELARDLPDEPEPGVDVVVDSKGRVVVTDTLKQNIYYHLALAQYLMGDYSRSLVTWRECMRWSTNPDTQCAAAHWQTMALAKLGRFDEIANLVAPITADLPVAAYHAYHQLCLMYKGELAPERVLASAAPTGATAVDFATLGYGVGNWLLCRGETENARAIFERVTKVDNWAAFGCIASEYELSRWGSVR